MFRRTRALIAEAHRRHVWGVVAGYGAAAFVVAQVADIAFPALGVPTGVMTVLVWLLIAGVVPAFILPWAYDLTPAGLKRTPTNLAGLGDGKQEWGDRIPAFGTAFVGRKEELGQLREMLTKPDTRLVSVVGPGGMGKSRLALELAGHLESMFSDGVALARLDSVDSRDGLAAELAAALGILVWREWMVSDRSVER